MWFKGIRTRVAAWLCMVLIAVNLLSGCVVEAIFTLAPESRLPGWFSLPAGLSRDDVVVKLNVYAGGSTEVVVIDSQDQVLLTLSMKERYPFGRFEKTYPYRLVLEANGVEEVVEHKERGPIFYISDDPELLRQMVTSRPR